MFWRTSIVGVLLAMTAVYVAGIDAVASTPIARPLASLPWELAGWQGRATPAMSPAVAAVLATEEQAHRVYVDASGHSVGLFVAYYGSQRQREAIHSPLNCLPGAGWQPLDRRRVPLAALSRSEHRAGGPGEGRDAEVNRVLIGKGQERQLVFYWYQARGRVIASEYWSKFFTVLDAIRAGRTDAAVVRVNSPVDLRDPGSERAAEARLVAFTSAVLPVLREHLPE